MIFILFSPTGIVNLIFDLDIVFLKREASQGICLAWFPPPDHLCMAMGKNKTHSW